MFPNAASANRSIFYDRDRYADIKKGAMENGMAEKDILLCDDVKEILTAITSECQEGDAVLLEGRVPKGLLNLLRP